MSFLPIMLAYLSPETFLPMTSIIATVVGCLMLMTKGSIRFFFRCIRAMVPSPRRIRVIRKPHFPARDVAATEKASR